MVSGARWSYGEFVIQGMMVFLENILFLRHDILDVEASHSGTKWLLPAALPDDDPRFYCFGKFSISLSCFLC